MSIPVYILPSPEPNTSKIYLYKLFKQSSLFTVVDPPHYRDAGYYDGYNESRNVISALEHSYLYYPHSYSIIIKDSSVTNSNIHIIENLVESAIELNRKKRDVWDLCYLCRWLDRCDLYKELVREKGITKIVRTHSPLGIQSIMFSPKGRNITLGYDRMKNHEYFTPIEANLGDQFNREISLGNLKAVCMVPNLFDYNVMLAKSELDYLKLSNCRGSAQNVEPEKFRGAVPLVWYLVITIGVVALAWFFYQFIAKEENPKVPRDVSFVAGKGAG